jgi:hypothetical protein
LVRHGAVFFLARHIACNSTLNISRFYRCDKPFILFLNRREQSLNQGYSGFNRV